MEEQRKSHKGLWVIGAVVVILLFCAFFFRVKKVSIEGNTYYSSREMEEKFQSNIFEKNILTFWQIGCSISNRMRREWQLCAEQWKK